MFESILYFFWFALPSFFFLMALWSKLEQMSGKKKQERPADFVRQGIFVLCCVGIAVAIDRFVLRGLVTDYSPAEVPLGFYQIMLLPVVLTFMAKVAGPTKSIKIEKAADLSKTRRRR